MPIGRRSFAFTRTAGSRACAGPAMLCSSIGPQASKNCSSCLRAPSSFQARSALMMAIRWSTASSRRSWALSASARSKRAWWSFGLAATVASSSAVSPSAAACSASSMAARTAAIAGSAALASGAMPRMPLAPSRSPTSRCSRASPAMAATFSGSSSSTPAKSSLAPAASPASAAAWAAAISSSVAPGPDGADQLLDEGLDLALGQRAHEAVDRLALLEGDDGGDRLDAELAGDLRMLVDVHLDQLDLALGALDHLLDHRGQLLAGAAPGRPEIDQHRLRHRFG